MLHHRFVPSVPDGLPCFLIEFQPCQYIFQCAHKQQFGVIILLAGFCYLKIFILLMPTLPSILNLLNMQPVITGSCSDAGSLKHCRSVLLRMH